MDLTIKFISTVGTIGSSESTVERLDKLSRAAGKFNVTIGTSIKRSLSNTRQSKTSDGSESPKQTDRQPSNTKVVTKVIQDCSPEDATLIAKCLFDFMERQGNSEKYTERKARFDTEKRMVLAELGVDNYDLLTPEQRKMYASKMIERKAPFTYTECSIHMKYGENQTIYSATQRKVGNSPFSEDFFETKVDLKKLNRLYTVSFRNRTSDGTATASDQ